jgi:hypothetical protein
MIYLTFASYLITSRYYDVPGWSVQEETQVVEDAIEKSYLSAIELQPRSLTIANCAAEHSIMYKGDGHAALRFLNTQNDWIEIAEGSPMGAFLRCDVPYLEHVRLVLIGIAKVIVGEIEDAYYDLSSAYGPEYRTYLQAPYVEPLNVLTSKRMLRGAHLRLHLCRNLYGFKLRPLRACLSVLMNWSPARKPSGVGFLGSSYIESLS